jgi:hypothetical protein
MITAEQLRALLIYDPDSGRFFWKPRTGLEPWNAVFAGKEAGSQSSSGYVKISINNRTYLGHRLAWLIMTGEWPACEIDHKDGMSNRWGNLREATRQQNQQNRSRHKSNSSGFKGVCKNRSGYTWSAQIYRFGKKIHVGCFATAEAAHAAYCVAASQHYGEFARTA